MFSRTETLERIELKTSRRNCQLFAGETQKIEGGQFLLQIYRTRGAIDSERVFSYDLAGEIEIEHTDTGEFVLVCKWP